MTSSTEPFDTKPMCSYEHGFIIGYAKRQLRLILDAFYLENQSHDDFVAAELVEQLMARCGHRMHAPHWAIHELVESGYLEAGCVSEATMRRFAQIPDVQQEPPNSFHSFTIRAARSTWEEWKLKSHQHDEQFRPVNVIWGEASCAFDPLDWSFFGQIEEHSYLNDCLPKRYLFEADGVYLCIWQYLEHDGRMGAKAISQEEAVEMCIEYVLPIPESLRRFVTNLSPKLLSQGIIRPPAPVNKRRMTKEERQAKKREFLALVSAHPTLQNDSDRLAKELAIHRTTVDRWIRAANNDPTKFLNS